MAIKRRDLLIKILISMFLIFDHGESSYSGVGSYDAEILQMASIKSSFLNLNRDSISSSSRVHRVVHQVITKFVFCSRKVIRKEKIYIMDNKSMLGFCFLKLFSILKNT